MATPSPKSFLFFVLCVAVMVVPGLGFDSDLIDYALPPYFSDDFASGPVIDFGLVPTDPQEGLAPEPYPGYYNYLDSCIENVPAECGENIVGALLKKNEVSYVCCQSLIAKGSNCNSELVKAISSIDMYKEYADVLPQGGSDVWKYCILLTTSPAPSISA